MKHPRFVAFILVLFLGTITLIAASYRALGEAASPGKRLSESIIYGEIKVNDNGRDAVARGIRGLRILAGRSGALREALYFPETGRYLLTLDAPGRWTLGAALDGASGFAAPRENVPIEVRGGDVIKRDIFLRRAEAIVSGTIAGPDGIGAKETLVHISSPAQEGATGAPIDISTGTDERGRYLAFVPSGRYLLRAFSSPERGTINPEPQPIEITAPGQTVRIGLTLRKTDGKISGSVRNGSAGAERALVWGWSETGGYTETKSTASGAFALTFRNHDTWHVQATWYENGIQYASEEKIIRFLGNDVRGVALTLRPLQDLVPAGKTVTADAKSPIHVVLENGARFFVPEGAVAENGPITVSVKPAAGEVPFSTPGSKTIGVPYFFEIRNAFGKLVTSLRKPAQLELPYKPEMSRTQDAPALSFWDARLRAWRNDGVPSITHSEEGKNIVIGMTSYLAITYVITSPGGNQSSGGGAFDFTVSNGGSASTAAPGSASTLVTATLLSGTSKTIAFNITSQLPTGVTADFSQPSCSITCSTILTLAAAQNAAPGVYPVTVTALDLSVTPPTERITTFDFMVTPAPTPSPSPTSTPSPTPTLTPAPTPSPTPVSTPGSGPATGPSPATPQFAILNLQLTPETGTVFAATNQPSIGALRCERTGESAFTQISQILTIVHVFTLPPPAGNPYLCVLNFQNQAAISIESAPFPSPSGTTPGPGSVSPSTPLPAPTPSPSPSPSALLQTSPTPSPSPQSTVPPGQPPSLPQSREQLAVLLPQGILNKNSPPGREQEIFLLEFTLQNLGYAITPDTKFDADTEALIRRIQREHGIIETGTYGSLTRNAIRNNLRGISSVPAATPFQPTPTALAPTPSPSAPPTPAVQPPETTPPSVPPSEVAVPAAPRPSVFIKVLAGFASGIRRILNFFLP